MKVEVITEDGLRNIFSARRVVLVFENKEFRISENQLKELVVNKQTFNEESSTIQVLPRVSNEIELK